VNYFCSTSHEKAKKKMISSTCKKEKKKEREKKEREKRKERKEKREKSKAMQEGYDVGC
jgi:hypothetical protein